MMTLADLRAWFEPGDFTVRLTCSPPAMFSLNHGMVRWKYHWREPGFFRVNICGWRFVFIDSRKHKPVFSDRLHGLWVGRFGFRISACSGSGRLHHRTPEPGEHAHIAQDDDGPDAQPEDGIQGTAREGLVGWSQDDLRRPGAVRRVLYGTGVVDGALEGEGELMMDQEQFNAVNKLLTAFDLRAEAEALVARIISRIERLPPVREFPLSLSALLLFVGAVISRPFGYAIAPSLGGSTQFRLAAYRWFYTLYSEHRPDWRRR